MAPGKQLRTFISYSRTNKDFALKLATELRSAGFPIWLDQLDIPTGARWDDQIEAALDECEIFMVILTPASIASNNVKDEIGYAIDSNKRILPILLENANLPFRLRRFQYVDFTAKSYDEGVEAAKRLLSNLMNELIGSGPEMPPIPPERTVAAKAEGTTEQKVEGEPLRKIKAQIQEPIPAAKPGIRTAQKKETKGVPIRKKGLSSVAIGILAIIVVTVAALIGVNIFRPSIRTNPSVLSAPEAEQLNASTEVKSFSQLAREKYSEAEISTFADKNEQIRLELTNSIPLKLGYGWCSTTPEILDDNLLYVEFVNEFNGQRITESNLATEDFRSQELYCRRYFAIIDNWTSGEYTARQSLRVTKTISDGESEIVSGTSSKMDFVISVP